MSDMYIRLRGSVWLLTALALAAASCRKIPPPPVIPIAPPIAPAPIVVKLPPEPLHPPVAAVVTSAPLALMSETKTAPTIAYNQDDTPSSQTRVPGGTVRVWAEPAKENGDKSDVFAVREDDTGRVVTPTVLLRRTSGNVTSVLVAATQGVPGEPEVWVSWLSLIAGTQKGEASKKNSWLVAAVRTTPALARVSHPVTILNKLVESDYHDDDKSPLLIGVAPRRGGLAVSYALGDNELQCGMRHVDYISPDGMLHKLGVIEPKGGEGDGGQIIDLGNGVLAGAESFMGGAVWGQKFFPYVLDSPATQLRIAHCDSVPRYFYFNGHEVITHCPAAHYDPKDKPCPLRYKDEPDSADFYCPMLFVQRLDGTVLTPTGKFKELDPVPITADRDVCSAGRWVREFAWKGGAVRLEWESLPGLPLPSVPCKTGEIRRHRS